MKSSWVILLACLVQVTAAAVTWRQVFDEMCKVEKTYKADYDTCEDKQVRGRLYEEYLTKMETRVQLGSKFGVKECEKDLKEAPESLKGSQSRCSELREILDDKCRLEAKYALRFKRTSDAYISYRLAESQKDRQTICKRPMEECCLAGSIKEGEDEAREELKSFGFSLDEN